MGYDFADIFSQQRRNRRITIILIIFFIVLVGLLGFAIDVYSFGTFEEVRIPIATIFALSIAGINGFVSYFYGSSIVLKSLHAQPIVFENPSHKQLYNVVSEMCIASGLPRPKIYVIPDPAPNAFATGRNPENASIGVTQGLLDTMNRDELQAVVAHEMGHIRNYDILTMTVVTVLVGTVVLLSDWATRTWRYGGVRTKRDSKSKGMHPVILILIILLIILAPLLSRIIAMAVSRQREYQADTSAAEFTRNPAALASALEKIAQATSPVRTAHKATAHLFISDPLHRKLDNKEGFFADVFSTHPPIQKRIERLKKMAYVYANKT
ncbi:MAG: M48 family metallopeptidase [Deltaproteobacteria bacterium]|nr:M48 family metallopeptidase [Deltaproteobacteria bacterium]